jgi:tetratricopeptide (TPR) repeat protein
MVFAVPLVYLPGIYDYFLLPKLFAFYLCLALACLGWLIQTRWGQNAPLARSPLLLPALCLMAVALLSSAGTTHPLDTLVELVNQAALVILLLVAASTLTLHNCRPVLWSSALTGLAVALIGILQYHGLDIFGIPSNAPPSATFANRNLAAEYLICAIPLSALLFLTARRQIALWTSGLSAALMGVLLVYTRTRAAWVGITGALLCLGALLIFWPGLRRLAREAVGGCMDRSKGRAGVGLLLLFLLLSALPPLGTIWNSGTQESRSPDFLSSRFKLPETKAGVVSTAASVFQKEAMKDASVTQRLAFWKGTLRMVADHPLLGVGPGGWIRAYPPYDGGATITPEGYHRRPHNDYLWIASEYGLLGLGVYLWLLIVAFKCLLDAARGPDHPSRIAAWMFALSLLSILGAAFFGFPKEQPQTALFPYLILGLAASASGRRVEPRARPVGSLLLTGLLLISLVGLELTRRRIAFDRHYLRAFSYGVSAQNWPAVLTEAQRAQEYGVFRSDLLFFKGLAQQNLGRFSEAEAAYRQTLAFAPHTWYAHDGLGFVYLHTGRLQDALAHCQTALSLCPGATYIHTNMGVIHQQMGNAEQAEKEFRMVLRTTPNDVEAHLNLGSLYRLRGQLDSAVVHYRQALRINPAIPLAHLILGNALYDQNSYGEALSAYGAYLSLSPGDTTNLQFVKERMALCEEEVKK